MEEVECNQSFCPNCGKKIKPELFETTAKIFFRNGRFYFEHKESGYDWAWQTFTAECYIKSIEVIGNIHENPELLKETL